MSTTPKVIHKNRYELDQMADGFSAFIESFPSFNQTLLLDEWRETQYNRLDANGQIYLDYTGGGLYSDSQPSLAMTDLVEGTRKYVLQCLVTLPASALCLFARRFFRR